MKNGFKIIDFRCRPPIKSQKLIFDLKLGRLKWENKFNCIPAQATSESMFNVGKEEGLKLLLKEMDEAGVDFIVFPGRNLSKIPKAVLKESDIDSINVTDDMLVELKEKFENRAFGLHGINLDKDIEEITHDIEIAIKEKGLYGAVLETGFYTDEKGEPLKLNNKKLYPIYETMRDLNKPLMLMSGIYAGHDIEANTWGPLDRVMQDFPELKIILGHGGYPRVYDAIALAVKHPNLYLSPDIYCFFPGGKLYVEAISYLPDQFIFGSAYPFSPMKEAVDLTFEFDLDEDILRKYFYDNAAKLLEI